MHRSSGRVLQWVAWRWSNANAIGIDATTLEANPALRSIVPSTVAIASVV
jgi:hypothetical protein